MQILLNRNQPPVEMESLLKPFEKEKRNKEYTILRSLYLQTFRLNGRTINEIIFEVDNLANSMLEGYEPLTLTRDTLEEEQVRREWRRDMKKIIEWAAHPRVGMDRLAIALACVRDMVLEPSLEGKWDNIKECRAQLVDLYNTVTPNPFRM